jgi:amphi-Trp domain-containing protein
MEQTPQPDAENIDIEDADAESSQDNQAVAAKFKAKGKIRFDSVMQRSEAVAYFSALIDGLRHGQLMFRHGDENLSLEPSEQVAVEVKASRKGDKEKVAFELEWKLAGGKGHELQG